MTNSTCEKSNLHFVKCPFSAVTYVHMMSLVHQRASHVFPSQIQRESGSPSSCCLDRPLGLALKPQVLVSIPVSKVPTIYPAFATKVGDRLARSLAGSTASPSVRTSVVFHAHICERK